jgi:hypothetical protein
VLVFPMCGPPLPGDASPSPPVVQPAKGVNVAPVIHVQQAIVDVFVFLGL